MRFHPKPDTERGQVRIFCGSETLGRAIRRGVHPRMDPSDFDELVASDALAAGAVDPRDARKAGEVFARRFVEVVSARPRRSERRRVVAAAGPRQFRRRNPHAPLRHADLRALAEPTPKTSRCSIAPGAATSPSMRPKKRWRAAAASTTTTTPRLRRHRLRHRSRRLARPAVDRRRRDACASASRAPTLVDDLAAARRLARRPIDHERPLRPAVRLPRQPPERRRHQPAGARCRRTRMLKLTFVYCGPPRGAGAGRQRGRRRSARTRSPRFAGRSSPPSRASSTATAAPGIRRPRRPTTPRRRSRSACRRRTTAWRAACCRPGGRRSRARKRSSRSARSTRSRPTQPLRYLAFIVSKFVRASDGDVHRSSVRPRRNDS